METPEKEVSYPGILAMAPIDQIYDILHDLDSDEVDARGLGGRNAVFYAVQRLNESEAIEVLNHILGVGVNVNVVDDNGQTPMFYAAREGHVECMKRLYSVGENPNHTDFAEQTPLYYAARDGRLEAVRWLVSEGGAAINHVDINGDPPLFYAVRDGRDETVSLMINDLGADVSIRNYLKQTASAIARRTHNRRLASLLDALVSQQQSQTRSADTMSAASTSRRRKSLSTPAVADSSRKKETMATTQGGSQRSTRSRSTRKSNADSNGSNSDSNGQYEDQIVISEPKRSSKRTRTTTKDEVYNTEYNTRSSSLRSRSVSNSRKKVKCDDSVSGGYVDETSNVEQSTYSSTPRRRGSATRGGNREETSSSECEGPGSEEVSSDEVADDEEDLLLSTPAVGRHSVRRRGSSNTDNNKRGNGGGGLLSSSSSKSKRGHSSKGGGASAKPNNNSRTTTNNNHSITSMNNDEQAYEQHQCPQQLTTEPSSVNRKKGGGSTTPPSNVLVSRETEKPSKSQVSDNPQSPLMHRNHDVAPVLLEETESVRDLCCLQYLGAGDCWCYATPKKLEEFEALFPEISRWNKEQPMPIVPASRDPFRQEWHSLALDLMNALSEVEGAWLFNEPVDPDSWGIPEYRSIVKKPMDFCTIKRKLNEGTHYLTIEDLVGDVELVFYNCILFNSATSDVGKLCLKVQSEYVKMCKSYGVSALYEAECWRNAESDRAIKLCIDQRKANSRPEEQQHQEELSKDEATSDGTMMVLSTEDSSSSTGQEDQSELKLKTGSTNMGGPGSDTSQSVSTSGSATASPSTSPTLTSAY